MKPFDQFVAESKKESSTVKSWIRNGLVNGASYTDNTYQISDLARPPYTRASSKNAAAIRKGIVVGCKRRLSVNARVFDIPELEFEVYADQVQSQGLIEKRIIDGVTYYYSTPKADELTDSQVYRMVKDFVATVVKTVTETAVEKLTSPAPAGEQ